MAEVFPSFDEVRAAVGRHVPALDGLRGLAILLVLVHNAAGPEGPSPGAVMKVFDVATNIGWVGVQLFFVLSGFLITGILLDTKGRERAWRSFFMRRVLRIFPLYYAALVVAFVVAPLVRGAPSVAEPYVGFYLAYLQNWSSAVVVHGQSGALGHFWSLAVEEQFYLAWPLVVFLLPRRALAAVAGLLVVAAPAVRVAILALGWSNEWAYQGTLARMDALALGGLGALALRTPAAYAWIAPRLGKATWALAAALAVVVVAARGFPRQNDVSQTVGYSVLALFFLALLISAVLGARAGSPLSRALESKPLRVLGQYSYGLYVFHVPISDALHGRYNLASGSTAHRMLARLAFAAVVVGLSFAGALASYHLFEKRLLDLKRFFAPGPMNAPNLSQEQPS